MFNKYLVITGEDCDVHDPDRLAALLRRAEFPRDLIVSEGVYDVLDHATATPGFGGKLAFDLTEIDPSAPAESVRVPERFEPDTRSGRGRGRTCRKVGSLAALCR